MFTIFPAIDIKGGRCVRLLQGQMDSETIFSSDPAAMAGQWEQQGAKTLHVVDLDAAFEKSPKNVETIRAIVNRVRIPIQLGGGIRNMDTISMYFDLGVDRLILGTAAIRDPELLENACRAYPGKILLGIDARDGKVAIEGWVETTNSDAIEMAKRYDHLGLYGLVFTDIHKDGMQTGPNIEMTRRLAESINTPVIASGGVADIGSIKALLPLVKVGLKGAIVGKALYTGQLNLAEALQLSEAVS